MPGSSSPRLTTATATLSHADARLSPLVHVLDLVSASLDESVAMRPAQAAKLRDMRLYDRVQNRVLSDTTLDANVREYWFAQALKVAIENDDLPLVTEIHELYPGPLGVASLRLALQRGSLEMIQWVVENRCDQVCSSEPGIAHLCRTCLEDALPALREETALATTQWLADHGALARMQLGGNYGLLDVFRNSSVFTRWLRERSMISTEEVQTTLLKKALELGDVTTAVLLLDDGVSVPGISSRNILVGAAARGDEAVVDLVISRGVCASFASQFVWAETRPGGTKVLQWKPHSPFFPPILNQLIAGASACANLDVLQWLYNEHSEKPDRLRLREDVKDEAKLLEVYKWMENTGILTQFRPEDMDRAAGKGFVRVVQWLHAEGGGGCTVGAIDSAASIGHLELIKWLHENRPEGFSDKATYNAAVNGHLAVVRWLHEQRATVHPSTAMVHAANHGHLDVVVFLYEQFPDACAKCTLRAVLGNCPTDGMSTTNPCVLRWLHTRSSERACTAQCVPGRLGERGFTLMAMAATRGNLPLLNCMHENLREHGDLFDAAHGAMLCMRHGHGRVRSWLRENYNVG